MEGVDDAFRSVMGVAPIHQKLRERQLGVVWTCHEYKWRSPNASSNVVVEGIRPRGNSCVILGNLIQTYLSKCCWSLVAIPPEVIPQPYSKNFFGLRALSWGNIVWAEYIMLAEQFSHVKRNTAHFRSHCGTYRVNRGCPPVWAYVKRFSVGLWSIVHLKQAEDEALMKISATHFLSIALSSLSLGQDWRFLLQPSFCDGNWLGSPLSPSISFLEMVLGT